MSFLLNRDACVGFLKQSRRIVRRCTTHPSQLRVSAITMMSLEMWLLRSRSYSTHAAGFRLLLQLFQVVSVDDAVAHRAAVLGHGLRSQRRRMNTTNLLVAATALEHGLTLVTRQGGSFSAVSGLLVVDWAAP
jgi:predicted nucleic acid-binding protein